MSDDTTDLSALPIDPSVGGGGPQNMKIPNPAQALAQQRQAMPQQQQMQMQMQPQQQQMQMPPQQPHQPQQDMNAMINSLQDAAAAGVTNLPARDIPMQTVHHAVDPQTRVEHVPQHEDYIESHNDRQRQAVDAISRRINKEETVEVINNELQGPLIMAALFFIFQLPFLRKGIMRFLPSMLNDDGHYNIYGYVVVSILFAGAYYGIDKAVLSLVSA
tara:strand:+ start:3064 stop:3714 length:651 start_codon:yes stop_codon:yes gene_type:complete